MTQSTALRNADGTNQPQADTGHHYSMPTPNISRGSDFWKGVVGPATLSVLASKIAVDKATDQDAKDFANFELREALAVATIMNNLGITVPPMQEGATAFLASLESTPPGPEFDRIYVEAELANHEFLRDLAGSYLSNGDSSAHGEEGQTRLLATLAITAFKEHVVLTKNILDRLNA